MASNIPEQIRAVDPFASYNSNTVNQLTRMATDGENALKSYPGLNIIEDSTSPTTQVVVTPGTIYMEDVLISVTEQHVVDFTDSNNYVAFDTGFDEDGWYAIVFNYNYVKSRPAPQARIQILKPSQWNHSSLGSTLHFLKAIYVTGGGPHYIDTSVEFSDWDPDHTGNKREYTDLYFGVETDLPVFNALRDRGRVVYESSADTFWFGYDDRWSKITSGVEVAIDTTGVDLGAIVYTDSDGKAAHAEATSINTGAELIVQEVGLAATGQGRALLSGFATDALVETGIVINVGDLLYLSGSEPGRVTNERGVGFRQVVGRALTGGNSAIPINILFFPRDLMIGTFEGTIEPGDWVSAGAGLWQDTIDISDLDTTGAVLVNIFDADTDYKVYPVDVEIRAGGNGLRIYTNDNTVTWNYLISAGGGGAGSGGGGGTTDHSILFNLDFASSNHTGFATDIHTHELGDTHDYNDIPTGETILFAKDTAVTGYSLEIGIDDELVYISSGGAGGLKPSSTWTQPNHTHTTDDHALVESEIPAHNHAITYTNFGNWTGPVKGVSQNTRPEDGDLDGSTSVTGIDRQSLNMGIGNTGGGGVHNHGPTLGGATAISWRPRGQNFTRQTRI